jgi:dTDP-L-rhamnose 4-epimerase
MIGRVLISGGAGFIGCTLAPKLLADNAEVVIFDNLHPQVHTTPGLPARLPAGATFVPGDVTVASNWATLLKYFRPDTVVHLAAETGTGQSLTEANRHAAVNVSGTALLLDALTAAKHVPQKFLLASSRAIYGDGAWRDESGTIFYPTGRSRADLEKRQWDFRGPTGLPARPLPHLAGSTQPNPISVYAATKLTQEHLLAAWCRAFGSQLTVLRLQNVYGPGQSLGNPYTGVLTLFARFARERKVLDIYEDAEIIRDFVHVEDVATAMVSALSATATSAPHASADAVRTYDIGSGAPTTIGAVARLLARRFSAPEPVVSGKFRDGDVRAASCDISAARRDLGYAPRISIEAGLETLARSVEDPPAASQR